MTPQIITAGTTTGRNNSGRIIVVAISKGRRRHDQTKAHPPKEKNKE
jgi:hypothetical protein